MERSVRQRVFGVNMTRSLVLFAVLVCSLASIVLAIKIDCNKSDSINEDHIHLCCRHPDGHNAVMEACAKETGFKLPSPEEESLVDITAERAVSGTCFGKCVFDKLKFMKDGDQLDLEAVRKHYASTHGDDAEYVKEMVNAFDHCHGQAEDNTARFLSSPLFKSMTSHFCEPKPSVIWACVVREFFHNCPADRWSNTEECRTVREFSQSCKDALTSM